MEVREFLVGIHCKFVFKAKTSTWHEMESVFIGKCANKYLKRFIYEFGIVHLFYLVLFIGS
jgi:hypothetical protein